MTSIELLFNKLWEEPKDKLTWFSILEQAKEMHYKELMGSMQKGMELQEKENSRIGFRERNGLLPQQKISDEEIDQAAPMGNPTLEEGFVRGAKWYREQLKEGK
jgi:hypothetical protein